MCVCVCVCDVLRYGLSTSNFLVFSFVSFVRVFIVFKFTIQIKFMVFFNSNNI